MEQFDSQSVVDVDADPRRMARRSMIKKSAAASAAAWAGAMVIDGIANPAAAVSCTAGSYSLVYSSPGGVLTNHTTNPGVPAAAVKYGIVSGTTYGTAFSSSAFNHAAASPGNIGLITVSISTASCANCYIESVYAAIHLQGAGCCPSPYYAYVGQDSRLLSVTAGGVGVGNTSVTFGPQTTLANSACNTANNASFREGGTAYNAALHWGAPTAPGCTITNNAVFADGWVVINVKCT